MKYKIIPHYTFSSIGIICMFANNYVSSFSSNITSIVIKIITTLY